MNQKATTLPDPSDLASRVVPALVEAGQALIAQMHLRASRGIGLNDAAMPQYSDSYAERKRKRGRDATTRNLTETGSMLRSIHIESVRTEGTTATLTIGFSNANDLRKAAYNQQIAPWFGASPRDQEIIGRLLETRMAELLKGAA